MDHLLPETAVFVPAPEAPALGNSADSNSTFNETASSLKQKSTLSSVTKSSISPTLVVSTIALGVVIYRLIRWATSERPPRGSGLKPLPGPRSTVPYLGRVHDVDPNYVWNDMKRFNDQYKGLFSCTLGGETHIWVGRQDIAQDLLCKHGAISSARADLGAYPEVTEQYKYLPLMGYTDHLIRQRKFAHQIVSGNLKNGWQGYVTLEAKRFLFEMLRNPKSYFEQIPLFCARISSRFAYGTDNHADFHVANARMFISTLGPSWGGTNLMPFLRFFPEWLVPGKRLVRERQEKEQKMWTELFYQAKEKAEEGQATNTYVSAYLDNNKTAEPGKQLLNTEDEAIYAVGMMCTVAIITIAGPATLFIMAMILHPEWQQKVRDEIDQVVGDGMVELHHSPQLPTLRAAMKECLRWKSTVPLGVPRLLEDDYSYDGYHFPKGGVVHVLDVALARDEKLYPDAETYNPDRWLDASYPTFQGPTTEYPRIKGHHIFGRGRRMCPGQDLVEAEMLLLCGNLIKFFELGPKVGVDGKVTMPDPDQWGTSVIGGPLPFECDIKVRGEGKKQRVERMYREVFA